MSNSLLTVLSSIAILAASRFKRQTMLLLTFVKKCTLKFNPMQTVCTGSPFSRDILLVRQMREEPGHHTSKITSGRRITIGSVWMQKTVSEEHVSDVSPHE